MVHLIGVGFITTRAVLLPLHSCDCGAVEEAIIALVRLYQSYTFKLADQLLKEPLEVKQGITMSPKNGVPATVIQRNKKQPAVAAAGA